MITPNSRRIIEIFSSSTPKLVIPPNQRNYDWGAEEVTELIEDLSTARLDGDTELFLGNIIFDHTDGEEYRIVDGQQRLTTISIVLVACRTMAKRLGNESLAIKIQEKLTYIDNTTGEDLGIRLITSPSIQVVYEYMCKNDWDETFPAKVGGRRVKRQSNKIRPIYNYVINQIENFDEKDLSSFLDALYNAYVIQIDIYNTQEAFDMFERTNARGLDLNVSDLVKNFLYADDIPDVEEVWDEVVKNSGNTLQRMLKYYYISVQGHVRKKDLYRNIKSRGRTIGTDKLSDELYNFSRFYLVVQSLEESEVAEWLSEIECDELAQNEGYVQIINQNFEALKLFKITQIYPVLYSIFGSFRRSKANETSKRKLLFKLFDLIEKYHFVNNMIVEKVGNEVEMFYAEVASRYNEEDFFEISELFISTLKDKYATKEEFVSNFSLLSYESTPKPLIHYIFDRFNNYDLKQSQRNKIYSPSTHYKQRNYNIEHILPQSHVKNGNVDEETLGSVHSIGNLLVISRHSNSEFGNMSPEEKIEVLKDAKHSGTLKYLKNFINQYGEEMESWNGRSIAKRTKEMAEGAYDDVWTVSV